MEIVQLTQEFFEGESKSTLNGEMSNLVLLKLYCGEIYNKNALKQHLNMDLEDEKAIILTLWEREGIEGIKRLDGVFSIVIHDHTTSDLWLIRDRFGIKPLFWAKTLNTKEILFSTSAKKLAVEIEANVDYKYCARGLRYKAFEFPHSGSPFQGVNSVLPGSWVKISLQESESFTVGQWYDLKKEVEIKKNQIYRKTKEDLQQECYFLVERAIQKRLQSTTSIALTVSGGLDSSTIAAFASKEYKSIMAFSYGDPSAFESEGPHVELLTKFLGMSVSYIWPSLSAKELHELLLRTLQAQEAPFGGLSVLAQNQVFHEISKTPYRTVLGGQGGDEIFAGYRKFFIVSIKEALKQKEYGSLVKLVASLGRMLLSEMGQANIYLQSLSRYRKNEEFSFDLLNWNAPEYNLWGEGSNLSDRQIEDIQYWSIPSLLRFEYRNAVANNIKTRLPFLDHELVEFALALPATMKISNGFGKAIVRDVTENVIPDKIRLNRKKRGFDVTQSWIKDGLGEALRTLIIKNKAVISPHLLKGINLETLLDDKSLAGNRNRLDEALMLAWLVMYKRDNENE